MADWMGISHSQRSERISQKLGSLNGHFTPQSTCAAYTTKGHNDGTGNHSGRSFDRPRGSRSILRRNSFPPSHGTSGEEPPAVPAPAIDRPCAVRPMRKKKRLQTPAPSNNSGPCDDRRALSVKASRTCIATTNHAPS